MDLSRSFLANQPEELNSIRPAGEVDFSGTLVRVHIGPEDIGDLILPISKRDLHALRKVM